MYIQYYAKWRKTKSISAKVKNKTRVSTLLLKVLFKTIRQKKEIKVIK